MENRLSDLWSIFDFTHPGLFGSAKEFMARDAGVPDGQYFQRKQVGVVLELSVPRHYTEIGIQLTQQRWRCWDRTLRRANAAIRIVGVNF